MSEDSWQALSDLNPATSAFPARARVDGEGILIFRLENGYRGVQRTCPHMQATLVDAQIMANDTMIRCTQHIFTFKLSNGKGVNCPGFRIKVFEVKEEDGVLYARAVAA